ncbi:MAG: SEC-C motif-containing protein [Flavobacteriales bacterium]
MNCPCGNTKPYLKCCEAIHFGKKQAHTAEQLMRSRFTAFTMANGDYLMSSHHTSTRPESEKDEIVSWAKSVKWLHLEIINTIAGQESDTKGTVEFKAHFKEGFFKRNIHENSKFIKEDGKWVYLGKVS